MNCKRTSEATNKEDKADIIKKDLSFKISLPIKYFITKYSKTNLTKKKLFANISFAYIDFSGK